MKNIHDFAQTLFTRHELVRAYNQILVAEEHIPLTALTTPFGMFGLINAAQIFQWLIDEILLSLYR